MNAFEQFMTLMPDVMGWSVAWPWLLSALVGFAPSVYGARR